MEYRDNRANARRDGFRPHVGRKTILDFRKTQIKGRDDQIGRAFEPFLDTLVLQRPVLLQQTPTQPNQGSYRNGRDRYQQHQDIAWRRTLRGGPGLEWRIPSFNPHISIPC